ncbi:unnamed protein product [Alopecurus aequalis]
MADPPAPELTNVNVQWCGVNYDVGVAPAAKILGVKREICEEAGLPTKRQKITESELPRWTTYEHKDDDDIDLLQFPYRTELVGWNENVGAQVYKEHYSDNKKPTCTIKATKKRLQYFDGSMSDLREGTYKVGMMSMTCLIKYYKAEDRDDLFRSIQLMRNWNHQNLVVMENMYNHKGLPRLVLSNTITGTLDTCIKESKKTSEEDLILNSNGTFTIFFTNMILDLCGVLDQMIKRKLCPKDFNKKNLYFNNENDQLKLKMLFDKVDPLDVSYNDYQLKRLCKDLELICTPDASAEMDDGTQDFLSFLGNEAANFVGINLAKTAKNYPINWTQVQKSKFLIDIIPSSKADFKKINDCGIEWPLDENGDMCDELKQLRALVEEENDVRRKWNKPWEEANEEIKKENILIEAANKNLPPGQAKQEKRPLHILRVLIPWSYDTRFPHHLPMLTRNMWKHYPEFPLAIKQFFGSSRDGTLEALERWCGRKVWALMYNKVGLGSN